MFVSSDMMACFSSDAISIWVRQCDKHWVYLNLVYNLRHLGGKSEFAFRTISFSFCVFFLPCCAFTTEGHSSIEMLCYIFSSCSEDSCIDSNQLCSRPPPVQSGIQLSFRASALYLKMFFLGWKEKPTKLSCLTCLLTSFDFRGAILFLLGRVTCGSHIYQIWP